MSNGHAEQTISDNQGDVAIYSLLGLTLASSFPFKFNLTSGEGLPDLSFDHGLAPPTLMRQSKTPGYASPYLLNDGRSACYLFREDGFDVYRFTDEAEYYLFDNEIYCHLLNSALLHLIEIRLLGPVIAYWLERRGIPVLHSSAVVSENKAITFLGTNGQGKSTLMAAMLASGLPLLTDDILPVHQKAEVCLGSPSYPQIRLWPDQVTNFVGGSNAFERVHPDYEKKRVPIGNGFGTFCNEALPLCGVYIPERYDADAGQPPEITIDALAPGEAVMQLVRHSFLAPLVQSLGLQPGRMEIFAQLVEQVPVKRLRYPNGFKYLPRVIDAIQQDIQQC